MLPDRGDYLSERRLYQDGSVTKTSSLLFWCSPCSKPEDTAPNQVAPTLSWDLNLIVLHLHGLSRFLVCILTLLASAHTPCKLEIWMGEIVQHKKLWATKSCFSQKMCLYSSFYCSSVCNSHGMKTTCPLAGWKKKKNWKRGWRCALQNCLYNASNF